MAKAEIISPSAKSTINSYRSFGYNLSTAIADIIDNSISAKAQNVYLSYEWNGQDSFIMIVDDGNGMNHDELIIAMTPGGKDPDDERAEDDLGRFGMGLKTASFSQCKSLTCATKTFKSDIIKRKWDIDYINETNVWQLLDNISDKGHLKQLENQDKGTLILWEKLDRIIGEANKESEFVKHTFYDEMINVKKHIALVFHRFIESNRVSIYFQGEKIEAYNPFLLNLNPKPQMLQREVFSGVEITPYILPHMSRLNKVEYEKYGGALGWFNQQGFYVYRGDRLLVAGSWLGLDRKKDYSKLARISVNFPNENDFDWNLDIKKSTATPPLHLRKELQRIAKNAIRQSYEIYNERVPNREIIKKINEPLWKDSLNREGVKKYNINREHPIIKTILKDKGQLVEKALKLLENNVPVALILSNQNEDPSFHEMEEFQEIPSDDLISLAKELFDIYTNQGVPESLAKQQIMSATPFNLYPIIETYLT